MVIIYIYICIYNPKPYNSIIVVILLCIIAVYYRIAAVSCSVVLYRIVYHILVHTI